MDSILRTAHAAKFIERRIAQASADDAILAGVTQLVRLLQRAGCDYLFVGSCALQTHLPYPHRLPNDIDVVISKESEGVWKGVCDKAGINVIEKPARMLIVVEGILVHVLSGGVGQVDSESEQVFDFLSLDPRGDSCGERKYWLVGSHSRVLIPVPSIEAILAMTLLRPLNSNTFLDCQAILRTCNIGANDFTAFCRRTPGVERIVSARLKQLFEILKSHDPRLIEQSGVLLGVLAQ